MLGQSLIISNKATGFNRVRMVYVSSADRYNSAGGSWETRDGKPQAMLSLGVTFRIQEISSDHFAAVLLRCQSVRHKIDCPCMRALYIAPPPFVCIMRVRVG